MTTQKQAAKAVKVVANYEAHDEHLTLWGVPFNRVGTDDKAEFVAVVDEATAASLIDAGRAKKA